VTEGTVEANNGHARPAGLVSEPTAVGPALAPEHGAETSGVAAEPAGATRQAAFFDLDKTVIARASMVAFGRSLYRGGLINRRTVLRALYAQLVYLHLGASEEKLDRIRESVLKLTRGWQQSRVAEIVAEALEQIVDPIIYAEAADLIDQHRAAGRYVVLISASPTEIVSPLGRYLGADATVGSRAQLDEEGRYTGAMEFYAYGEFKAEAIRELAERERIDLTESYAYTDSYTDLPMLEAVGHPIAVNPDRVLTKYAREHNFEITRFVQPVRLRDRVRDVRLRITAVPPRPVIAVSVGAVAFGTGAFALGWWYATHREMPAPG
jgi:HAD superfamily hydrolase (TIGR01490 family)